MAFGSGHYASMQQQLPTMSPQRPQQQQRTSGFPTMTPGQMRSPNNGMIQPDMDLVLHQQQQYQQQPQQYGSGNYQGYNGGYQGPRAVSSQTHSQTMSPYQTGFPSETGYPPGASGNQTMGEFGPQAGPNQPLGMAGPASLSLAAMSNRQQYYSDGYGMNQPVSPVHKQMPQGGGFLQPSGLPYSQQVQTYHSGSYPKRPPSSPVQTQMQGFSSGASSYTPRSNAGMQMPNMAYQSSTNPYQPPHSPSRRSSSTSPVPQQDVGLYSRPRESFPQPRSPFGPGQAHFQQQQQQPQQQSSCMFVQPSTTLPQPHYQSQQLMSGTKTAGLTQRRASYPGQHNTMKMPSPPLKRSPPSKAPSPNPKSPDPTRAGQLGFEEKGSIKKPVAKKIKSSSPPSSDRSEGISEATGTVSNAVQCSFKQKAASKKVGEGQKGVPRKRRSASDADRPSVLPPTTKKDGTDGDRSKAEEKPRDKKDAIKSVEGLDKAENAETKSNEQNGSNRIMKTETSGRHGGQEETSVPNSSVSKDDSCGNVGEEQSLSEVNRTKPDKEAGEDTTSESSLLTANFSEERKEQGEDITSDTGESGSNIKVAITEPDKTNASPSEKVDSNEKDEVLSSEATEIIKETSSEGSDVSSSKNAHCKEGELSNKVEHQNVSKESEATNREKNAELEDQTGAGTVTTCSETDKAKDKTSKADCETGQAADTFDKLDSKSEKNVSELGTINQLGDETVVHAGVVHAGGETGKLDKTGDEPSRGTCGSVVASTDIMNINGKDKEKDRDDNANKTTTKGTEEPEKFKESASKEKALAEKDEASSKSDACEGSGQAKEELASKSIDGEQAVDVQKKEGKPAVPSLRCDERLSSDDDDRLGKTREKSESGSAPVVENRTLGIQTIQQPTATARTTQQQATPIKATIIAKGKSSQNNQQVMVAKTTTGQMYLIQGNILVPVQTVSSKDDVSKQNTQLIIVNPMKTGSGQQGEDKLRATAAKGGDGKEESKERKDERAQPGNCQGSRDDKASKGSVKEKADNENSFGDRKSHAIAQKLERSPNGKMTVKIEKLQASKVSKTSPTQPEKSSNADAKEKQNSISESPRGKQDSDSKNPDKLEEMSSPSEKTNQGSTPKLTRGRPVGSKDKQKRKSYVHKVKRKHDEVEIKDLNAQELAAKPKFSKTAVAIQELSSSGESSAASKRPLEVPTVSASKSPKKRKISTSSSPVKHISTRPRGGIDGDSWVCSLCGKGSGYNLLGDLYGPYKTKFSKEKTDSSSKEGKQSQKLSSPGRKSSSSSDVQIESENCDVDLWIHRDCGVWSPGVFMLGRTIHGLEQAVESAAQHVSQLNFLPISILWLLSYYLLVVLILLLALFLYYSGPPDSFMLLNLSQAVCRRLFLLVSKEC